MKLPRCILIYNKLYQGISGTNKYIGGPASGGIFMDDIKTYEEIKAFDSEMTEFEQLRDIKEHWSK